MKKCSSFKLSPFQEKTIRAIGYGLDRHEVADSFEVSLDQVDSTVAQAYEKLHILETYISSQLQALPQTRQPKRYFQ